MESLLFTISKGDPGAIELRWAALCIMCNLHYFREAMLGHADYRPSVTAFRLKAAPSCSIVQGSKFSINTLCYTVFTINIKIN